MLFLSVIFLTGLASISYAVSNSGTLHKRSYFYVGGTYTIQGNSSIRAGQMYVEHLIPETITKPLPIVLIHGHDMTGTNFLNTPDGRPGWADFFLGKGYELYIVDQPSRGRSAWQQNVDSAQSSDDTFTIQARFTAAQLFKLWPQASLHTQWPGNGTVGDPIFDAFYASTVPSLVSDLDSSERISAAGQQLLDKIGPAILLTHSQSGPFGWILGDARPKNVVAIVSLEPTGPPFMNAVFQPANPARPFGLTETPISYTPPIKSASELRRVVVTQNPDLQFTCFQQAAPARKLTNLSKVPVLVVTSESSYHAVYDSCTVGYLKQGGVNVKHVNLQDVGIHGNGHMMFMELNGLDIAERVIEPWIAAVKPR